MHSDQSQNSQRVAIPTTVNGQLVDRKATQAKHQSGKRQSQHDPCRSNQAPNHCQRSGCFSAADPAHRTRQPRQGVFRQPTQPTDNNPSGCCSAADPAHQLDNPVVRMFFGSRLGQYYNTTPSGCFSAADPAHRQQPFRMFFGSRPGPSTRQPRRQSVKLPQ